MLWIFLSQNASTNTKYFYHNSWEMKFILSTQGASRAALFFSPLNVRECFLDRGVMQDSFLTYMHFQDIQCTCIYFFSKINQLPITPHPPPAASEMVRPTNRGTQHVLHVPVTGNISGQMHVLCIRNFVTYAGLKQIGKWPLLKIRGQWAMRFSDISGHRCIRICIVLPIFFYNWWLQRLRVN